MNSIIVLEIISSLTILTLIVYPFLRAFSRESIINLWCTVLGLNVNNSSSDGDNIYIKEIMELHPYHVTILENFIRIFEIGKLLSKKKLQEKGVEYIDLGKYGGKTIGPRYLFYNFKLINNREVIYSFKDASSIDLDEYVRFYLFIANDRYPRFIIKVWKSIMGGKVSSRKVLIIIVLKKLKDIISRIMSKYLIIYGPGAGYGQVFNNIKDFSIYVSTPSPDPLKVALQNLIRSGYAGIEAKYYDKILASEFCIKDECPLSLIDRIYMLILKDVYDEVLKETISIYLKDICKKIERNVVRESSYETAFVCTIKEGLDIKFHLIGIKEIQNISLGWRIRHGDKVFLL